ncbi:unnamed protein product [Heligmosomoides polygyrus]|uniref:Secreted RxLR effector peptide protein n=1 Tax=Heligmosomoides polygyrus TaxID=6339 RepID=A0A183FNB7_HELPZ|nr:unnamed protein product [Heligmosomoides polygyrus]
MRFLLYTIFAIASLTGYSSADDGKVRQLRDQEESELKKIAGKEERDLVKSMSIEAEVTGLKAAIARPKRDALSDLFMLKPLIQPATKAQLRRARQAQAQKQARTLLRLKRAKAQKRPAAARRAAEETD